MTSRLIKRRLLRAGGFFLIGDGLMRLWCPRRPSLLSHCGPELSRAITEELIEYPKMVRSLQIAKVAVGVALALGLVPEDIS